MGRIRILSISIAVIAAVHASNIHVVAADKYGLIISVDGLKGDWACYPDKHDLKIPNISKLALNGIKARVTGVFPSVTYPSHTTLITGCYPAKHGILANEMFEPPTALKSGKWYWNYSAIKVPTLLDAAKLKGWTTAAVSWPVCVGAPVDMNFPEVWEPGNYDDHFVEISKSCKPADLIPRILTRYTLGKGQDRDVSIANAARYIVDAYKPRLMLVHLVELDSAEHSFGPDTPEARAAAERCDERIGEILARYEAAGLLKNTVVAIVSDHGFLPTKRAFQVNVVLTQAGLIRPGKDEKGPAADWDAVGWNAGASCSIMLKNPGDTAVLDRVRKALASYTGKPDSPILRVLEKDDIARVGGNPGAAIMLDAGDNWTFGSSRTGAVETDSAQGDHPLRGMHGQMPDRLGLEATFVSNCGIGKVTNMEMIQVAPTLAEALGLKLPTAEGTVISPEIGTNKGEEVRD